MTTPELRTSAAGGEVPATADELSRLASQIYAQLTPLQVAAPAAPPTAPVAPRGSAPDATAVTSLTRPAGEAGAQLAPVTPLGQPWQEPNLAGVLPGLDSPPYTVPVAPRGSAPDATAATSLARPTGEAGAHLAPATPAVPAAAAGQPWLEPDLAGVLPGGDSPPYTVPVAPRGSAPGTSAVAQAGPGEPVIPAAPAAPLSQGERVPNLDLTALLRPWGAPLESRSVTTAPATPAPVREAEFGGPGGVADRKVTGTPEQFDVHTVRGDFPILAEEVNGHPLIWFDNAATTQKPQAVIDRLAHFYAHENSNIHRAAHELAARATDAYEDARDTVRDFLGAGRSEEVIFVRGATEGINLVAQSWGRKNLRAGDEILITHLEHHANVVPWQIIAQATGAVLKVAPVDDRGNLLLEQFTQLLGPRTKLVAATAVANAIGTVTPVRTIVELAHRVGARVLIDGAQSVPHLAVDLRDLDPDFFVFSGHKVFGPTGIGAVFINERVWDDTPAWQGGGNMIADVTIERSLYQGPPNKYEAGTGNIADAVGLAAALRYVNAIGIERIEAYEHHLLDYATPRLAEIPGVRLIGTADQKASVLSFLLKGYDAEEVGKALNERGIAVRAGHHCAQPILRRLGVEKTVRPSFAFYNTVDEIEVFLQAVRDLSDRVRRL